MSPETANGSSRLNFPAPGRGRESPELDADPPIIPRSMQKIALIHLTRDEMLALVAKKKDRR